MFMWCSYSALFQLADLNEERGTELATALGSRAMFVVTSVTERGALGVVWCAVLRCVDACSPLVACVVSDQVQRAVDLAISTFGSLDGVVHCAGVGTCRVDAMVCKNTSRGCYLSRVLL